MMVRYVMMSTVLLAGCSGATANPMLACQQRIVDVQATADDKDVWRASGYVKIDKAGCSAQQLADIRLLHEQGSSMDRLSVENEKAGGSGDEEAHMLAFQAFNNALIAYEDLQNDAKAKLVSMKSSDAQ